MRATRPGNRQPFAVQRFYSQRSAIKCNNRAAHIQRDLLWGKIQHPAAAIGNNVPGADLQIRQTVKSASGWRSRSCRVGPGCGVWTGGVGAASCQTASFRLPGNTHARIIHPNIRQRRCRYEAKIKPNAVCPLAGGAGRTGAGIERPAAGPAPGSGAGLCGGAEALRRAAYCPHCSHCL